MQASKRFLTPLKRGKKMTNSQLNAFLETIAKLVEAKALTVAEAVDIIRNCKA